MALSRNQYVDLPVLTSLDIALVVAGILLIVAGLFALRIRNPSRPCSGRTRSVGPAMRRALLTLLTVVLLALTPLAASSAAGPQAQAGGSSVPTLAYFYQWFTTSSWDRAKVDYPMAGRYSSDDVSVMRRQVAQAKAAGIDGFIVSWKDSAGEQPPVRGSRSLSREQHTSSWR